VTDRIFASRSLDTCKPKPRPDPDSREQEPSHYVRTSATPDELLEGMSVTLSYMFRKPITSQYPDRMSVSVNHTIPARYRGFLEWT